MTKGNNGAERSSGWESSYSQVSHPLTSEEGGFLSWTPKVSGSPVHPSPPISALLHELPHPPPGDPKIKCPPFHPLIIRGTCNALVTLNSPFVESQLLCARTLTEGKGSNLKKSDSETEVYLMTCSEGKRQPWGCNLAPCPRRRLL